MRLQVISTHKCNARCDHCDKAIGYAKLSGLELTAADMQRAQAQATEQRGTWFHRATISGGEPVLNPELQGIVDAAAALPACKELRVLTNDLPGTAGRRAAITLPANAHWVAAPLDDPTNPLSGKNDPTARNNRRTHWAYWISPADIGMEATWEKCETRGWCGKGLSPGGWSMCGQAPILSRLLDIPAEKWDCIIREHVNTPIPEMCRHCVYGLSRAEQNKVKAAHRNGDLPDMTPTYAAAFGKETASPAPDNFVPVEALTR